MADNPYTTVIISGYNATPPADDGTKVAANQVEWAKHETKLSGPVKDLAEGINSGNLTAFQAIADTSENINAGQIIGTQVFG